ncbi:MAG: 1-acyl-sn-glycerol-3-phosphate acyltransferase [Bacteroidales bacterium]|nr:1-acyl-sn-glycerol-3-phosphate acyltransferase [Bacteroidales bacterium]
MVYFNIVEKRSVYYRFWRRWIGHFFAAVYYRKFVVKGTENLPPVGTPYMIVSNHQNGLLDALCILFGLPERHTPIFLARADIFKKPFVAKILCFCKILPIYRQRDGKEQLGKNEAIFDFAARMIGEGAAVSLFPEGHHQEGHYLGRFKKGFARIAFDAAERKRFPDDMLVVPAANHYVRYRGHRTEAMLTFGAPVRLADYYAAYRENPVRAMVLLAEELEGRVRGMMLDTPYPDRYVAMDIWRELAREPGLTEVESMLNADRAWAMRVRNMSEAEVERGCSVAASVAAQLRRKGSSPAEWPVTVKWKDLLTHAFCLLIYAPFALCGFLLAALPFGISWRLAGKFSKAAKTDMLFSTFHFVLDLLLTVLFDLVYTVLFAVFVRATWWMLPIVFGLCLVLRVAYVEYRALFRKSVRQCRAYAARKDAGLAAAVAEVRAL